MTLPPRVAPASTWTCDSLRMDKDTFFSVAWLATGATTNRKKRRNIDTTLPQPKQLNSTSVPLVKPGKAIQPNGINPYLHAITWSLLTKNRSRRAGLRKCLKPSSARVFCWTQLLSGTVSSSCIINRSMHNSELRYVYLWISASFNYCNSIIHIWGYA